MFDDPLSALDAHVARHVFDQVIGRASHTIDARLSGPKRLRMILEPDQDSHLSGTTRVLVTNALNFLPKCDHVIVIDQGQIVESGTYQELKSGQSKFSKLLREFTGTEINEENLEAADTVQDSQGHEDEDEDLADVYTVDDGTSIIGKVFRCHRTRLICNDAIALRGYF